MIPYVDTTKNGCPCINADIIADGGAAAMAVAEGYQLQTIEITPYRRCIQIGGITVFQVSSGTDMRAPDVAGPFRWQQPFEGCRPIIADAIVEQVSEGTLACAGLDEVADARPTILYLAEVSVNLSPECTV